MNSSTFDAIVHSISLASPSGTSRLYELRPADPTSPLPAFEAGAHIDVHLGTSLIRQYSLLNSPQDSGRYVICVRRDDSGRGGSTAMHRDVTVGRRLRISAPRNLFPLLPAQRYVLLAGGIGITPLLSMAEELHSRSADFVLHHYTADEHDAPLLERARAGAFADRVVIHHTRTGDSVRTAPPEDLRTPDPTGLVYICGPDGFMTHVTEQAGVAGWRADQLHLERFAPAAREPDPVTDGEFRVRVASTGDSYPVPADMTIAEVLTANGVAVELSCEQGMCGACLTPVLAGQPDHRDEVQTDEERAANDQITICCSRARSPELVLGL